MSDSKPIDYLEMQEKLIACDSQCGSAEAHGVLCGLLCSGADDAERRWLSELLPDGSELDLLQRECRQLLSRLHQQTHEAISGPGLGFSPLLPDDQSPLRERGKAMAEWCQGFLYGVGLSGIDPERQLSAETREALRDFTEITRLDLDALEDDEEQEDALAEVTEFLWVAAMLVYEELVHDPTARS